MAKFGIGVLTYNGAGRTYAALRSIKENTDNNISHRIYVVDDGSSEKELVLLRQVCQEFNVGLGEHRKNVGISAGWNHLVSDMDAENYVLLNDDVKVTPGWLNALDYFLSRNGDIGAVGLHQTSGNGCVMPKEMQDSSKPYWRLWASGYAFAFTKYVYKMVGPFDESYYSFYEDIDWGVRCIKNGLICLDIPPVIQHTWGETFRTNPDLIASIKMAASKNLFENKMGDLQKYYKMFAEISDREIKWISNGQERSEAGLYRDLRCDVRDSYVSG